MTKLLKSVKRNSKKVIFMTFTSMAVAVPCMAGTPATGNTDLDTIIGSMDTGLASIKVGGLYILAAVILIAITFFGARWLWNMWRSWMSRA